MLFFSAIVHVGTERDAASLLLNQLSRRKVLAVDMVLLLSGPMPMAMKLLLLLLPLESLLERYIRTLHGLSY
ncbi:hypothetical protein HYQ46_004133 [Verticillium longisporum]|nr:hypothetical protein HYQ46_004133 [Verticillium longisporum]